MRRTLGIPTLEEMKVISQEVAKANKVSRQVKSRVCLCAQRLGDAFQQLISTKKDANHQALLPPVWRDTFGLQH